MKISFDQKSMPDALYNALLQHFVNEAVAQGISVNKYTRFSDWVVECNVEQAH